MVYTAVTVIVSNFLFGVLSALAIYAVLFKFLDKSAKTETAGTEASSLAA